MSPINGIYKFALLAIPLMPLLASPAPPRPGSGQDPTGESVASTTGPPTPADNAAQAFSKTSYALIPLDQPSNDGLTHEYVISCITDDGEVDFTHFTETIPGSPNFWQQERLLWWRGDIDATTFYPIEGREYREMNRAGQYSYWERNPDPPSGGVPGPPDGVIASLKGVFVASDGSESNIPFIKYHDKIDSQALEWEQILLTAHGWSSVAISPQTDAIVNSCYSFFVQEDGTAFGSPAESREYSRTRIRSSNGTSFDDRVRNYAVTAWHHWNIGGSAPSVFDGAPTSKEFDDMHKYADILGSGGMGGDAFCFVIATASGQGGTSTNKWTLRDKTGSILVDLGQVGFDVQGGAPIPGFSRNGHVAQRMSGGCVRYHQPSAVKEVLPSAFGVGAGGRDVQVNDVGDLLLQNAQYTSNATADMLVRKFTDPATGKIVWGTRQFSDDTLPEGWSGLQIDALANAQPLAKQRELEAQTPSAYPPAPEDTPDPMLGGIAMKNGKQYPVLLVPVELVDTKNRTLDDGDDVNVEPKATVLERKDTSIAWIEPHGSEDTPKGPYMPQLALRFRGTESMGLKIKWRLAVKYNRPRGTDPNEQKIRDQDEVYIPKMATGQQVQPWKEEALDGAVEIFDHADWVVALVEKGFFGGEAELKYQLLTSTGGAMGPETTMLFSIGGKNPDGNLVKQYIDPAARTADTRLERLSYAVAKHESKDYNGNGSHYNEFWEDYARRFRVDHRKGDPLWCLSAGERSAGGFGIYQITGNLTSQFAIIPREQFWSWRKNVDAYITIVKTGGSAAKGSVMDRFFAAVARTYPNDNEAKTPPTNYAYEGGTYDAWEMGAITLYNGAGGCKRSRLKTAAGKWTELTNPWTFDSSRAAGSKWQYNANSNDYFHEVIEQK